MTTTPNGVPIGRYPGLTWWRLHGERGISSEAIADRLQYGQTSTRYMSNYPRDPDDFRRCELLLRHAPSMRADLNLMADQGPEWAGVVEHWDDILALIEADCPSAFTSSAHGSAIRAYALMEQIFGRGPILPSEGDRVKIGRRGRTVWTVVECHRDRHGIPESVVIRSERGTVRHVAGGDMGDLRRWWR